MASLIIFSCLELNLIFTALIGIVLEKNHDFTLYFYEPVPYLSIIKREKINCVKLRVNVLKRCLNIKIPIPSRKELSLIIIIGQKKAQMKLLNSYALKTIHAKSLNILIWLK